MKNLSENWAAMFSFSFPAPGPPRMKLKKRRRSGRGNRSALSKLSAECEEGRARSSSGTEGLPTLMSTRPRLIMKSRASKSAKGVVVELLRKSTSEEQPAPSQFAGRLSPQLCALALPAFRKE